jgi:hypothetical protein
MRNALLLVPALLICACASDDGAIARDDPSTYPYPWCGEEIRAEQSQPTPERMPREERRLLQDYHVSAACQQAQAPRAASAEVAPVRLPRLPRSGD